MKTFIDKKIITPIHDGLERYLNAEQWGMIACTPWLFAGSGYSQERAEAATLALKKHQAELNKTNELLLNINKNRPEMVVLRPILNMLTKYLSKTESGKMEVKING